MLHITGNLEPAHCQVEISQSIQSHSKNSQV